LTNKYNTFTTIQDLYGKLHQVQITKNKAVENRQRIGLQYKALK